MINKTPKNNSENLLDFIGSASVIAIAIMMFFILMEHEMPPSNRELLISFVSVLFGAMATSLKRITGDK